MAPKPPGGATRRQGNADLWPVLPVGAGTARRRRAAGRTPSCEVVPSRRKSLSRDTNFYALGRHLLLRTDGARGEGGFGCFRRGGSWKERRFGSGCGEAEGAERPERGRTPSRNERSGGERGAPPRDARDPAPLAFLSRLALRAALLGCGDAKEVAEFLQPVTPAADLDHMDVVQKTIQDRRGQHLVPGLSEIPCVGR